MSEPFPPPAPKPAAEPADRADDRVDDWADRQREMNRSRFDAWGPSAPHRARVTEELVRGFDPADEPRLTLLGVGPALDVDLPDLLRTFAEIVAADLDGDSLREGLARQGVADDPRVRAVAGDDLLPTAGADFDGVAAGAYLGGLAEGRALPNVGGRFEAAGSLALLTQLIERVVVHVGPDHPQLADFAAAVRGGHLKTLAGLLAPGGTGLLVCDLFSAVTCPELTDAAEADVPALVEREVARGNLFHGVHPLRLREDAIAAATSAAGPPKVQLLKPWRWMTTYRCFAVTGVKFKLAGGDGAAGVKRKRPGRWGRPGRGAVGGVRGRVSRRGRGLGGGGPRSRSGGPARGSGRGLRRSP